MDFRRELVGPSYDFSLEFDDKPSYIRRFIELYSATEIDRKYWLPERCKDFFVATVVLLNEGITNPISEPAVQIYKKYFSNRVTKRVINNYLTTCQNLGWLQYDSEGRHVKVGAMFYEIGQYAGFEFKIKVVCNESDGKADSADRPDNSGNTG